jgi:hypothetical protein
MREEKEMEEEALGVNTGLGPTGRLRANSIGLLLHEWQNTANIMRPARGETSRGFQGRSRVKPLQLE